MSNIEQIIEERPHSIGKFMVGRLLPFRNKRMVGPFTFIDHMGPVKLSEYENFDVPPHPHIGLSTLTYLFEGSIMHKDSLGSEVEIKPFEVNWMTAGRGIVHSERTPEYLRNSEKSLHGLQIWVAMPRHLEQSEPSFSHFSENELPIWEENSAKFKLIAGDAFGRKSPVPVLSSLFLIEITAKNDTQLNIGNELFGETAMYILEGAVSVEEHEYQPKNILVANDHSLCAFHLKKGTTVYIFGGEPFPEERFINWNFVASSKELLEDAKNRWINKEFPEIKDETDFVPYPQINK